jgi:hypothetical protein
VFFLCCFDGVVVLVIVWANQNVMQISPWAFAGVVSGLSSFSLFRVNLTTQLCDQRIIITSSGVSEGLEFLEPDQAA